MYRKYIKRCIDFVLALIALTLLFLPLLLLTLITAVQMKGNPFFVQPRPGYREKIFHLIKFRSMRNTKDANGNLLPDEQRLTSYGRFLRSTSLDELPELINVLKGDMSFIGPRPERPQIIAQYMEEMPEFALRMKVKAGLAGYAQVYGKYNTTPYDKLKLDLTYIENYSVWLDIKLMLLTLKILLSPESTEGVDQNQITAMQKEAKEDSE